MKIKNIFNRVHVFFWHNHTLGQTILKNTFWLSISQIASRFIRAIIVIYAARVLGVENYGIFSYTLAIIGFTSIFYDLGINSILIREITKNSIEKLYYLANAFIIKAALITGLSIILIFVIPQFINVPRVATLLCMMVWLFVFDGLKGFLFAFIRSLEKMEYEAIINTIANTSLVIIGWAILTKSPTPENLAIAYIISSGIGLSLAILIIGKHFINPLKYFSKTLIKQLLLSAWPFALIGFFSAFLIYTDSLMLGWLKLPADVGIYAAAQRPIQLLSALPTIIVFSIFPVISRLAKESNLKFGSVVGQSLSATLLLALPLTAISWILGEQIIYFLYGIDYLQSVTIFRYLSISFIFTFPAIIINYAIFAYDIQKKFIIHSAIGAIINILLNILLIPKLGVFGAALATITSQFITYSWMYLTSKQLIFQNVQIHIIKPLIATIITGILVWWLQQTYVSEIYWLVPITIVSYVTLLIILKDRTAIKLKRIMIDERYQIQ